jgi:hypothetical protein
MGIDYDGIGGIGIEFTDEIKDKLIECELFTEEDFDEDYDSCFEKLGLTYDQAGNMYSGDTYFYLMVDGDTLPEVNKNSKEFINTLSKYGVIITEDDLKVISDYLVS